MKQLIITLAIKQLAVVQDIAFKLVDLSEAAMVKLEQLTSEGEPA